MEVGLASVVFPKDVVCFANLLAKLCSRHEVEASFYFAAHRALVFDFRHYHSALANRSVRTSKTTT